MSSTANVILILLAIAIFIAIRSSNKKSSDSEFNSLVSKYADEVSVDEESSRITAEWEDIVFLDTENTGLGKDDQIVEIAIIDHDGYVLLNSLVNPKRDIPQEATAIHGITNEMVKDCPTLEELTPRIKAAVRNKIIAIYNAEFDLKYLPSLEGVIFGTICVMKNYAGNGRWKKLSTALKEVGGTWNGDPHRALTDAFATRDIGLASSEEVG